VGDDEDRSDLWGEAWSRPEPPADEPVHSRPQWEPGASETPRSERGRSYSPRHSRRVAQLGGRDAHLTFEPPEEYRPEHVAEHRRGRQGRGASGRREEPREPKPEPEREPRREPMWPPKREPKPESKREPRREPIWPPKREPKPPRPERVRPERLRRDAARALAPRGTVVGYHRGLRLSSPLVVVGIIVLALAIALAWWLLTRPAALALTSSPSDAVVSVAGHGQGTGDLAIEDLEPGTLSVTVARAGFETATVNVEVTRGSRVEQTIALRPLPFTLKFTTRPAGATVKVTSEDGGVLTGTTPCSIVTSAGQVTVSISRNGSNTFKQSLFVDSARTLDVLLDPQGQLVHALGSLTAKGAPKGVSVTPDGREAWATILNGPPAIQIYDIKKMRATAGINIGKYGAVEVIFNRDGTRAYASQMETAKVFEIDTATRTVLRSFNTESAWTKVIALSPDEKTLYAANWSGNDVSIIDLVSGDLKERIPTAKTPRGLWPTADGRYLYVAGFDRGDLQRIDLKSGAVKTLFTSGGAMRHLVADERTGKLYCSDMNKDVIWVCDMKTLKVTKFCKTDEKPNTIELSPDGQILFISNRGENNPVSYYIPGYEWGTILLISTSTGKPLDAIVGGNQCTALDVSADGHTLVFSDFLDDRLRVYSVPGYDALAQGNGGRYAAHFADLRKSKP
jgi:YVTN family beta-propeller protein